METIILATSLFHYLILWDKKMNKSIYSWLLNYFNFFPTIATDSKTDRDYFCFY